MNKRLSHSKLQFLLATAILLLVAVGLKPTNPAVSAQDTLSTETDKLVDISTLGIAFIPNMGQTDAAALYQVSGTEGELFFKSHSLMFVLPVASQTEAETTNYSAVELEFLGRNEATIIEALEMLTGKVNYLRGNDPSAWLTNIPSYAGIVYRSLYEGIDLSYFGTEGQLKSTFTLAPEVNPAQIRWQYRGAQRTWLDGSGNLMIQGQGGAILREQAPIAWQEINGVKQPVSVAFRVDAAGIVDFTIGDYDSSHALILDPVIEYSSYAGGSGQDDVYGIETDNAGHAFIAGTTQSANFPVTTGVISTSRQGNADAFVMKINTNASGAASLVWSTYIGGGGADSGAEIGLDSDGNVYITGKTFSSGSVPPAFPTTGNAYSTSFSNGIIYLMKINPTGTGLLYSSFVGSGDVFGLDVDSSGNAYFAGHTTSSSYPTTANAYQQTWATGQTQVFVSKIDTNASGLASLVYSTFVLASDFDVVRGLAADDAGNAYVTGSTESTDFPVTANAYQSSLKQIANGDGKDAFLLRIDTTQSGSASLAYSSYFGGQFSETGTAGVENHNHLLGAIATDGQGNAYLTGETNSIDLPIVNGYQTSYRGGIMDAFVAKIDTDLSGAASLVYSSYLGGNDFDQGYGISADSFGNVYVTGIAMSGNFPVLNGLAVIDGAFVMRLNTNASGNASLLSSTGVGVLGVQPRGGLVVDQSYNAYITGSTIVTNLPIVDGFQSTYVANGDSFVMRFNYSSDLQVTRTESSAVLPVGSSRSYTLTVTNPGQETATNVVLTEDLANIGLVNTAVSTKGTCAIVDTVVTCNLGNMFTNTNATITINFTSSTAGTFTKTAFVIANEGDPNMANNSHEGDTLVVNTTDLSLSQSDSPDPVVATEPLTYSITVNNNGAFDATNVLVTDTLPTGSNYVSAVSSQGADCGFASNKVTCNLGTIASSGNATVEVIITHPTAGNINNLVSVTSSEIDSNTTNNSSTISTTVSPAPPPPPNLLNPANSANIANLQPVFSWAIPARAVRYEIQLDTNPAMTSPAIAVTAASYTPTGPLLATTYYWRVRAFNAAGLASDWSSTRQVTIVTPNNAAPLTNYYNTATPTLSWNNVTWATQYEIQVDNSSNFAAPLEFTITVPASSLSVTTTALSEGTHYWRVRAINGATLGAWSTTASFLVDIP